MLSGYSLPSLAGYRLAALSNPFRIVPVLLALCAPTAGKGGAMLQWIHVPNWDDARTEGERPEVAELARLSRTPTAMTSLPSIPGRRGRWTFTPSLLAEIKRSHNRPDPHRSCR